MNFRKNRESRGLLIYSEPHTKVKKVSDKKVTLPKQKTVETPKNTEGGKEPQADTIINQ